MSEDGPAPKKLKVEPPSSSSSTVAPKKEEETISLSAALAQADKKLDEETLRGMAKGNINIGSAASETHELSESSQADKARHDELLKQLEAKKRARAITVPTNDNLVKKKLREMGEPITLFGERAPGRRERLHALLARQAVEGTLSTTSSTTVANGEPTPMEEDAPKKAFLTEGTEELREARIKIAKFSLERAKQRVKKEMELVEKRNDPGFVVTEKATKALTLEKSTRFIAHSSQIGDIRPISSCMFAPDGKILATASWTGTCKLWEIPSGKHTATLKGHEERCTDIAWHPHAMVGQSPSAANLATCAADGTVLLWPLESKPSPLSSSTSSSSESIITPLTKLEGHTDPCSRLAWHPSGNYIVSTSFDRTWRMWDVEKQGEIVAQVGHSRGTYGIAFQNDGALIATGDLGGNGLVWDLRTGKTIYNLVGHAKQVLAVDFAPTGYHIATGSGDHTVRIWDIRQRLCLYVIPAHTSLVSNVRYQPDHGNFLVSSGYDCNVKIWHSTDFHLIKTLAGHEGKVTRAECSPNSEYIATSSFDRTWKLWQNDTSAS